MKVHDRKSADVLYSALQRSQYPSVQNLGKGNNETGQQSWS